MYRTYLRIRLEHLFLALLSLVLPPTAAAQEEDQLLGRIEFERLRLYSGRQIDVATRMRNVREAAKALRGLGAFGAPSIAWRPLGPDRVDDPWRGEVAGRVSAIAIHPRDANILYVGGAQGGVWKSENRGLSWTPLTDHECSLAMGSIAIDPVDPRIIYAGTGEQHFSGSSFYGCGLLRSTDGGTTWERLGETTFTRPGRGGARIARVVVDPVTAGSLGATTVLAASDFGLFRSTDSGRSWNLALPGIATDLVMDPADPAILYAAFYSRPGFGSWGIHKSTDGGRSWRQASAGLRDTDIRRINLAIAPSAPEVLYAGIVNVGDDRQARRGLLLYRTDDGASTWRELEADGASCGFQCWYDMTLAVHPLDPERLLFGAVGMYLSEDGGQTFEDSHPDNLYVDQHLLVFDTLSGPDVVYVANDGGVYRSMDAGETWFSLAANLAVAQFYPGISLHPSDVSVALGGTQDQGTLRSSVGTAIWAKVVGGDGGFTAFDVEDPDVWYAETQWNRRLGGPRKTGERVVNGIDMSDRAAFLPPLVMDPIDSRRLYFGTQSIYRTDNWANQWVRIYNSPRRATVRALAAAPSDENTVYASVLRRWDMSRIAFTHDGGLTWEESELGLSDVRYIGDLAVHPEDSDEAYAVVGGFGTGHVFQTTDGGRIWRDRTGNLPDHPVNAVLYDPEDPDGIYIGTDLGVYHSPRGGDTWEMLGDGLPTVAVFDLAARPGTGRLVAATHGRGMFEIPIEVPLTARVRPESVTDTILIGVHRQRNGRVIVAPRGRSDHMAGWDAAVSGSAPWLTLTGGAGQGRGRFSYGIAAADLVPGDHTAAMEVTVAGVAEALTIPMAVHVAAPKGHMTLARTTTEKSVLVYETAPFGDSVAVTFEGAQAATVEWRATQPGNSRWLELGTDSGVGDGFVTWTVAPDSLDEGVYTDSVVIAANLATGSPTALIYTLSVEPPLSIPALRPVSSYGVTGWSFVSTDSLAAGLAGFGADQATWTASSQGSEWLEIEQGEGGRDDPIVWTRTSHALDPGVYEDTITIRVNGRPDLLGRIVDRFEVVTPMSVEDAAHHLLGLERLAPGQQKFLDWFGNRDGSFNAGDVLKWLDHCAAAGQGSGCQPPPGEPPSTPDPVSPARRVPDHGPAQSAPNRSEQR